MMEATGKYPEMQEQTWNAIKHTFYGSLFSVAATHLTTMMAVHFGWIQEVNILEYVAVLTSYICTYLCVFQIRWQYYFAAITTVLYVILFYQWGLYGSALANAYLPIALIYGWFRWGPDGKTREVTWTDPTHYPIYLAVGIVGWAITYWLAMFLGIQIPVLDSAILVLTIMAQFMMDNKKLECWAVWFVLNVIAIYLYFTTGLYLAGAQYVVFLANTIFAFVMWRRSMILPILRGWDNIPNSVNYDFSDNIVHVYKMDEKGNRTPYYKG